MKKYFLVAIAGLFLIPLFNSCNKPTGDPIKDAEAFAGDLEAQQQALLDMEEKAVEFAEYYAEQDDYQGYEKFKNKCMELQGKVAKRFERTHKKEIKELEKRLKKAEKILDNSKDDDRDRGSNYDDNDPYTNDDAEDSDFDNE